MSLVLSLSSIPSRFSGLEPVLDSIAGQSAKIDEIRLYIPKKFRRFPDYDGSLPQVPKNVRIIQPEEDLGPASKVLFAAADLKGTDCDIIYCDDDMIFEADRFARILQERDGRFDHCVSTDFGPAHFEGGQVLATRHPVARMPPKSLSYRIRRGLQIFAKQRRVEKETSPSDIALAKRDTQVSQRDLVVFLSALNSLTNFSTTSHPYSGPWMTIGCQGIWSARAFPSGPVPNLEYQCRLKATP